MPAVNGTPHRGKYRIAGAAASCHQAHVLALIDAIKALRVELSDVSMAYWRSAHNRFVAHQTSPPYGGRKRAFFLTRWALQS